MPSNKLYIELIKLYQAHHQELLDHLIMALEEIPVIAQDVLPQTPVVKVGEFLAEDAIKLAAAHYQQANAQSNP